MSEQPVVSCHRASCTYCG